MHACRPPHRQTTGRHSRQSLLDPDEDDCYLAPELADYLQRAAAAADSKLTRPTSPRPKQTLGSYSIPLSMPKPFQQATQTPSAAASPSQQQAPQSGSSRQTTSDKQPQRQGPLKPERSGNAVSAAALQQEQKPPRAPSASPTGVSTVATLPGPPLELCLGMDDIYWTNQLQAALMQQVHYSG